MKIDTRSWHYRWISTVLRPEHNLCLYVWQVPLALVAWIAGITMGCVLVIVVFLPMYLLVEVYVWNIYDTKPEQVFLNIALMLMWSAGAFGFVRTQVQYGKKIHIRSRFLSVLGAYWRAIHDKVCPHIEFERGQT